MVIACGGCSRHMGTFIRVGAQNMTNNYISRWATEDDLEALQALITLAINTLQDNFLSTAQVVASRQVEGSKNR